VSEDWLRRVVYVDNDPVVLSHARALLCSFVLNFLAEADDILARLVAAVPSGSYLALMQPTQDAGLGAAARRWNRVSPTPVFLRDRAAVARWFTGLYLVEPGLVERHRWRPSPDDREYQGTMPLLGAVGRKP
jgi:hypothetical protein